MVTPDDIVRKNGRQILIKRIDTIVYDDYDEIDEGSSSYEYELVKAVMHRQNISRKDRQDGFPYMGDVFITVIHDLDILEDRRGVSDIVYAPYTNLDEFHHDITLVDLIGNVFQFIVTYEDWFADPDFAVGDSIRVIDSTKNDGIYTVTAIQVSGVPPSGPLTIAVQETIPDTTVDGKIILGESKRYSVVDTKDDYHPMAGIPKKTVRLRLREQR